MKVLSKIKLLCFLILMLIVTGQSLSQKIIRRYMIVRGAPSFTLQIDANYNQSILQLAGTYNDDFQSENVYKGETFGGDKGFGGGILSKISFGKKGYFRFTQSLNYNRIQTYTFGTKTNLADIGKASFNIFTAGLGIEYNFTPAHRFKIYISGEINTSMINGDLRVWFRNINNPPPTDSSFTIKNSFRIGYGLMIGSEFILTSRFGLNIGARLTNANALLRNSSGTNTDKEFELRDKDDPNLNFAGNKNFAFYTIMAGINYYFGIKERIYKLN